MTMIKRIPIALVIGLFVALASSALCVAPAYAAESDASVPSNEEDGTYSYDALTSEEMARVVQEAQDASAQSGGSMLRSSGSDSFVQAFSGDTRFDTAIMQANAAYSKSDYVIIVGDGGWPDALAATGLAGILDCPILLTAKGSLSSQTATEIKSLGAKRAVVLGGPLVISDAVVSGLKGLGLGVDRLAGETRQDTQLMVYEYGKKAPTGRTWSADTVAFASGTRFHDALSFSPVSFRDRVPVFLTDGSGNLTAAQCKALSGSGKYATSVVLGGPIVTSSATVDFASSIASSGSCTRLAGDTRYDTSGLVAAWSVSNRGFSWSGAAFTTASLPYDALAGGVLQGKEGSVILLVDNSSSSTIATAAAHKSEIGSIKFFGGVLSVSNATRSAIISRLTGLISTKSYAVSFNTMYAREYEALSKVNASSISLLRERLDPASYSFGQSQFYQFARLDQGYSGMSAAQLNSFIATYGSAGMLAGKGQAFIDASKATGVNEVYLLSHAILESGWGTSTLAKGYYYDGKTQVSGKTYPAGTYYNFYGIGAVDSGPLTGGRALAIREGWNTPEKAIRGAAEWIKTQYIANGYGPQNTLYLMRWDIYHVLQGGTPWKQYATDPQWATSIASVMGSYYSYLGIDMSKTGLVFVVPSYR